MIDENKILKGTEMVLEGPGAERNLRSKYSGHYYRTPQRQRVDGNGERKTQLYESSGSKANGLRNNYKSSSWIILVKCFS